MNCGFDAADLCGIGLFLLVVNLRCVFGGCRVGLRFGFLWVVFLAVFSELLCWFKFWWVVRLGFVL